MNPTFDKIVTTLTILTALVGCGELNGLPEGSRACFGISYQECLALTAIDADADTNISADGSVSQDADVASPEVEDAAEIADSADGDSKADPDGGEDLPDGDELDADEVLDTNDADVADSTDVEDVPDVEDSEDVADMDELDTEDASDDGSDEVADSDDAEDTLEVLDDVQEDTETNAPDTEQDAEEVDLPDPCEGLLCTDGNPCTIDSCVEGECVYLLAGEDQPCNDSNPCTDGDMCDQNGDCQPGEPLTCDDGDLCTQDICDPETENGCVFSEPVNCAEDLCAPAECIGNGQCGDPVPIVCETEAFCMTSTCNPETGECVEQSLSQAQQKTLCSDGDNCTIDSCDLVAGECSSVVVPECKCADVICEDDNPCTDNECNPFTGVCEFVNNSEPCEDGDLCTLDDTCSEGACAAGSPKECADNDPCLAESCNSESGECEGAPLDEGACDDSNPCTTQDECLAGQCAGVMVECDDENPCTNDSCNPVNGKCVFVNNVQPCNDDNLCTTGDVCQAGECKGKQVLCEGGYECATATCDPSDGKCVTTFTDSPCNDDNPCTKDDGCALGECIGTTVVCDDQNPCTTDSCDLDTGECQFLAQDAGCCTTDEQCDDGKACTAGSCVDNTCQQSVLAEWCLIGDACVAGGTTNPDNECQACVTDKGNQKAWTPLGGEPCNDGNSCTKTDTCTEAGVCSGEMVVCDDQNPCTDDFCNSETGNCEAEYNSASCDDGDGCTVNDTCLNGACVVSEPKSCDDADACTADACQDGECVHEFVVCDDKSVCTVDFCDEVEQCLTEPEQDIQFSFSSLPQEFTLGGVFKHCPGPSNFPNLVPGVCIQFAGSVGSSSSMKVNVPFYGKLCFKATHKFNFTGGQESELWISQEGNIFSQDDLHTSATLPGVNSTNTLCYYVHPGEVSVQLTEGNHSSDYEFDVNLYSWTLYLGAEAGLCLSLEAEDLTQ